MKIENTETYNIRKRNVKAGCCVDAEESKVYEPIGSEVRKTYLVRWAIWGRPFLTFPITLVLYRKTRLPVIIVTGLYRLEHVGNCSRTYPKHLLNHPLCEGIPVLQLLAFTHVPPDVTSSKLCEEFMFGNHVWLCVYKIYGLFWWRISEFQLRFGCFSHWNLSLFWEFFNWSANTFVVRPITIRRGVGDVALESGVEEQSGRLGRGCVVWSTYRSKQCQKWVVILKNAVNKSAIITKNEVMSINLLNYKALEKSHATKYRYSIWRYPSRCVNMVRFLIRAGDIFLLQNVQIRYGRIQASI